jgi:hypothetical protein
LNLSETLRDILHFKYIIHQTISLSEYQVAADSGPL